jgi:phosphatidate cytidylyltransferase
MKKESSFGDLKKRFITSIVAIVSLVLLLIFAYYPFVDYFLALVVMAVSYVAIWEWMTLGEAKNYSFPKKILFSLAVAVPLSFFLGEKLGLSVLPLWVFFGSVFLIFLSHFKKVDNSLPEVSVASFGLFYLAVPLGMILSILYGLPEDGRMWSAYLLIVTKITDIAAYFCGKLFGRRKLASVISPKKTIEGALGGFIFSLAASIGFSYLSTEGVFSLSLPKAILLGAIFGVFSQVGDLSESLIKRDVKVKDSSALPGLGGVLDTLDSLLLNTPILFFFLKSGF